ncbi:MAG: ERCC4 domain-containing protein [Candidatus Aenigmarchaeota archaeon]|nr:ERCC4 domain-containing protein [Candidatus Aenigmarchaeota archaeon]MDI6722082.1 ERCC4 domain-containing protein [Candidatus Aenigmarchaeota archaeon]
MQQSAFRQENEIVIYVDNRELDTKLVSILRKKCIVREQQLEVADYLLSEDVACERKTCEDFLQSIVDRRLFEQLGNMRNNFESPFLIIEGDTLFGRRDIHENAIRGTLASIITDYKIPILWTESQLESAEMLFAIARREQLDIKKSISIRGKRRPRSMNEQQEFLLAGLSGINSAKAKSLLKHFGTLQKVLNAPETELQQVEGIGKELSRQIRKTLTSKYEKSILED